MHNGYEYEIVARCVKTGSPYMAPTYWVGNARIPGRPGGGREEFEVQPRPFYSTCRCCPEKVSADWIEAKEKANRKKK